MPTEIISRAMALAKGLKRYFTGKPCKRGHIAARGVASRACKECQKTDQANRRQANLDEARRRNREEKRRNPQKRRPEYNRRYVKNRRQRDLDFKLRSVLSNRMTAALRRAGTEKSLKTIELVGCSIQELWAHLERLFLPGMSRANYGRGRDKWNIDHIRPVSSFQLDDLDQQRACFHFTNLQPLWQPDNMRKGAKR